MLLFAIFCVALIYRFVIVFHNAYPPSSDIGMHGSIINLILDQGILPEWNPYHMGGEPLVNPPGFHLFTAILIILTGMPLIMAELVTATFFSAFTVFPAYLTAKKLWKSDNAGILAAFFALVSALSLEIISWGGYTNIISLALIVTLFYLYLKDMDKPNNIYLLIGALLFGILIITHTFTLFVFFPILIVYFAVLLIGKAVKLEKINIRKPLRFFTVSGLAGALIAIPWILSVIKYYINNSSEAILGKIETNKNLILDNRTVDSIILLLVFALIPAFLMFRASRKRWLDNTSILVVVWFLVPLIMTHGYIFGIYVDYSRFMYFIDFPGILIISASLFYLFRYTSIFINKFPKIKRTTVKKMVTVTICTAYIFGFIGVSLWSVFPQDAIVRVDYYTTIHQPEGIAMEWIKNNTPEDSVLVADHLFGWWLSGIAKRTTLSATGLEYLIYPYEMEVAQAAKFLLDTDYFLDNGLIQVRENGAYLTRHNPGFSIETWSREPYSMTYFQDNQTTLCINQIDNLGNKNSQNITLSDIKATGMTILSDENSATYTVSRENDLLSVNRTLTLQRGVMFAELSYQIATKDPQIEVSQVELAFNTTRGIMTAEEGMVGIYDQNQKACAQIIFEGNIPTNLTPPSEDVEHVRLLYSFSENQTVNINLLVGVFDAKDLSYPDEVIEKYHALADSPMEIVSSEPLTVWDYEEMMNYYNVSYVVCREPHIYIKFSEDPKFRQVFSSGYVTIFQVVK